MANLGMLVKLQVSVHVKDFKLDVEQLIVLYDQVFIVLPSPISLKVGAIAQVVPHLYSIMTGSEDLPMILC